MAKSDSNILGIIVVALVAFIALALVFEFWLAPTIFAQNKQAGENIAEEAIDRESALENYRWFRNAWYDIQSLQEQLDNHKQSEEQFHNTWGDDPNNWTRQAQERHGRIHDRITGTQNMLSDQINEYNARQSDATRAIFQCGLPYNVDEKLFIADATGVEYTSQDAKLKEPPDDPSECRFAQNPSTEGE